MQFSSWGLHFPHSDLKVAWGKWSPPALNRNRSGFDYRGYRKRSGTENEARTCTSIPLVPASACENLPLRRSRPKAQHSAKVSLLRDAGGRRTHERAGKTMACLDCPLRRTFRRAAPSHCLCGILAMCGIIGRPAPRASPRVLAALDAELCTLRCR